MEQVGYNLLSPTGDIIQSWGGEWGVCPGIPSQLILPNGDIVCAPEINVPYEGYKLVPWMMNPPPTPIPQTVPMWAVRTVLQNDGLFDQAQTAIAASDNNALKNVWEYGNFANRNSTAIAALAAELKLKDDQVDQMFIDANNIEV